MSREEKKSFIRNVMEFIGEFLEEMASMILWRLLIFVVPILGIVWFYFGSSGVTTALTLAWVFIVAIFTASGDAKNEKESK